MEKRGFPDGGEAHGSVFGTSGPSSSLTTLGSSLACSRLRAPRSGSARSGDGAFPRSHLACQHSPGHKAGEAAAGGTGAGALPRAKFAAGPIKRGLGELAKLSGDEGLSFFPLLPPPGDVKPMGAWGVSSSGRRNARAARQCKGQEKSKQPQIGISGQQPRKRKGELRASLGKQRRNEEKDTAREPGVAFSTRRELVEGIWCWVLPSQPWQAASPGPPSPPGLQKRTRVACHTRGLTEIPSEGHPCGEHPAVPRLPRCRRCLRGKQRPRAVPVAQGDSASFLRRCQLLPGGGRAEPRRLSSPFVLGF